MKLEGVIETVGGGLAATILGWFLSKSDSGRERKELAIKAVAAKVLSDALEAAQVESRLAALETQWPRLMTSLDEVNEKLDQMGDRLIQLLAGGHLHRRREDDEQGTQ